MTDDTVLDGNQQDPGEKGSQPQSSASQGQPSADVAALQKEIDELKKLYNGIKKSEDKINSRVEQRVSALTSNIERIAELAKAGKSQSEIEERLVLDEIIRERKGSGFSGSAEGTERPGQGQVDVQDIARQLNLDVNDKDIATAVASGNIVNVMKVAMSKATAPSASVEDAPLLTGGSSREPNAKEQIEKYITEMRAARGKPDQLRAIKNKYIQQGVNVHVIDLG